MEVQKVRSTYRVHCARGVNRGCQKCINEKAKGTVYELIEPDSNEGNYKQKQNKKQKQK
jgi:hypothetical protein